MDTGQKMTIGYRIKDANNYTEETAPACSQCVYVKRCSHDDYRCNRNPDVIVSVNPRGRCDKFEKSPQEGAKPMTQFKTYRTRPVTVEAVEITEEMDRDITTFVGSQLMYWKAGDIQFSVHQNPKVGDFIIKLSEDEIYLCPREVFLEKYEEINENLEVNVQMSVEKLDNIVEMLEWSEQELTGWLNDQGSYGTGGYEEVLPELRALIMGLKD